MPLTLLILIPLLTALAVLLCKGLKQVRTISLIGTTAQLLFSFILLIAYWKERSAGNSSQFLTKLAMHASRSAR